MARPFASSRDFSDQPATNIRTCGPRWKTTAHLLSDSSSLSPKSQARIEAASEGTDKLSPIVPEVERLLGPAKPVAEVLASLDRRYKEQGKPQIYFLKPNEPIAPHLDELLRPNRGWVECTGSCRLPRRCSCRCGRFLRSRAGAIGRPARTGPGKAHEPHESCRGIARAGLGRQRRTTNSSELLPDLEKLPANDSCMKGRARYHLAPLPVATWRSGSRPTVRRGVPRRLQRRTESNADRSRSPSPIRRASGEIKGRQARPSTRRHRRPGRARSRPRPLPRPRGPHKAPSERKGRSVAGPDPRPRQTDQRGVQGARQTLPRTTQTPIWFLPLNEPIAPHLDQLLGPTKTVEEVLEPSTASTATQGKPAIWFLPLNEPISPHLDELLGKRSK